MTAAAKRPRVKQYIVDFMALPPNSTEIASLPTFVGKAPVVTVAYFEQAGARLIKVDEATRNLLSKPKGRPWSFADR
jgi:hypothetical protein